MPQRAFAALYGPPGKGKSFLGVDFALSVATGMPWHGRSVEPGSVVYVAAEGVLGYKKRADSWLAARGSDDSAGMHFVAEAVRLAKPGEVAALLEELRSAGVRAALIIFDTISRCFAGRDEKATQAASALVAGVGRIRTETGAAVLLVHHSRKSGDMERGSSAFRGAVDVMMSLTSTGAARKLECVKVRETPEFEPIRLRLARVGDSCVLEPAEAPAKQVVACTLERNEEACLDALPQSGARYNGWRDRAVAAGVPEGSFARCRNRLQELQRVEPGDDGIYRQTGSGAEPDGISGVNPRGPDSVIPAEGTATDAQGGDGTPL